jgi:hypothetical protein
VKCACCGGEMVSENELRTAVVYKCKECGLSDIRLKLKGNETKSFINLIRKHLGANASKAIRHRKRFGIRHYLAQ